MAVGKLVMPILGLMKARYKGDKADIDSPFFKLHYRTTASICFLSSVLVTANNLIGKTIDCMSSSGSIPGNVMNTYCWIMSTFSIPSKYISFLPNRKGNNKIITPKEVQNS